MLPGHHADLQPGAWAGDAGSGEPAGSGGRADRDFFPKSLRVFGIQIYRHSLNAEAGEEEMEAAVSTGGGGWVGFSAWKSPRTFLRLAFKRPVTQIFTNRLFRKFRNTHPSKLAPFMPELPQPQAPPSCPFPSKGFKEKIRCSQLPPSWKKRKQEKKKTPPIDKKNHAKAN